MSVSAIDDFAVRVKGWIHLIFSKKSMWRRLNAQYPKKSWGKGASLSMD